MTKEKDNNTFVKSLHGVTPIKKSNKVKRTIPKIKKISQKKIILDKVKIKTTPNKETIPILKTEIKIEKGALNKKLKKGKIPINQKIDFHGCSLETAKQLFISTINDCFINNKRCILFITGKGTINNQPNSYESNKLYFGKIRNDFLGWTNINEIKSKILNIQQAGKQHGGDGAFFIYLRKNRN